jgi:hypothetical protein
MKSHAAHTLTAQSLPPASPLDSYLQLHSATQGPTTLAKHSDRGVSGNRDEGKENDFLSINDNEVSTFDMGGSLTESSHEVIRVETRPPRKELKAAGQAELKAPTVRRRDRPSSATPKKAPQPTSAKKKPEQRKPSKSPFAQKT